MDQKLETSKLAELRLKTDRQLIAFVGSRLDRAAAFAKREDQESQALAGQIHEEVRDLLPLIGGLRGAERRRLETKVERLAEQIELDGAGSRVQTVCS